MKRIYIIFILLNVFQYSNGQTLNLEIDKEYFLLGTLSDYMGREKYPKIIERVDKYLANGDHQGDMILKQYYDKEKYVAGYIFNTFKSEYSDLLTRINTQTNRLEIYSKSLRRKIDEFYTYKYSGRNTNNGNNDLEELKLDFEAKTKDLYIKNFDSIYAGSLKKDIFKNDLQKLSFLTGAYVRFGGQRDTIYYISLSNSNSKIRVSADLLKKLKCSDIECKVNKSSIPVGHTVYFQPTDELKRYFETFKYKLATNDELKKE